MDRVHQYKQRHVPFGSAGARMVRAQKIEDRRKERRAEHLSRIRNDDFVENDNDKLAVESKEETRQDRMTRLEKWKAERDLKKKLEAKNKKPIFKVGVPHRNIFSPTSGGSPISHCPRRRAKQCRQIQTILPKRITRATEKRLALKRDLSECCDTKVERYVQASKNILKVAENKKKTTTKLSDEVPLIAPTDYAFKGPTGINPLPLFGHIWIPVSEETELENVEPKQLKVPLMSCEKANVDIDHSQPQTFSSIPECGSKVDERGVAKYQEKVEINLISGTSAAPQIYTSDMSKTPRSCSPVPAEFSPYIVTSRGKRSARKEQRSRLGLNDSMPDIIPTKDTVMQNMNISLEEEEKTAQYYKMLLRQQIEKLTDLCVEWAKIQGDPETPEDGRYLINQAIGQANLLMQKKFERFRGLVSDCETGKGEMLVRCRDLQAFWDIIIMQIKDCELRFEKLSELKNAKWIENDAKVNSVKKKPITNKRKKIVVESAARAFIQAARKKKLGSARNNSPSKFQTDENTQIEWKNIAPENEKSTTLQATYSLRNMDNLLDRSFTVMKDCHMGKTPDIKLDSTVSYVNSDQTPGKSILKKSGNVKRVYNIQKSSYKVNFDETVMSDEQLFNRIGASESSNGVEKMLVFDEESFNDGEKRDVAITSENIPSVPDFGVIPPTSLSKEMNDRIPSPTSDIVAPIPHVKTPRKARTESRETQFNDPPTFNARVLRNRAVATDNSVLKRGYSLEKRSSSILRPPETSDDNHSKENEIKTFNRRRSSRRSAKFNVDGDCTVCAALKPMLPNTPKHNKKLSLFGQMNLQETGLMPSDGDLISFDSPITPRRRSKRTTKK